MNCCTTLGASYCLSLLVEPVSGSFPVMGCSEGTSPCGCHPLYGNIELQGYALWNMSIWCCVYSPCLNYMPSIYIMIRYILGNHKKMWKRTHVYVKRTYKCFRIRVLSITLGSPFTIISEDYLRYSSSMFPSLAHDTSKMTISPAWHPLAIVSFSHWQLTNISSCFVLNISLIYTVFYSTFPIFLFSWRVRDAMQGETPD